MNIMIKLLNRLVDKAINNDEVPVAAIITRNNKVVSSAYNSCVKKHDPTAHAEIECIRKACKKMKCYNLSDCELYCTLIPCNMCKEVIKASKIKTVYYILEQEKVVNKTVNYIKMTKCEDELKYKLSNYFKNKR